MARPTTQHLTGEIASQNEKGPAEAATSPSHGPNNPEQEKAMDTRSDTTKAALAAIPSSMRALSALEGPIARALELAKVAKLVADVRPENGTSEFKEDCAERLTFLVDELFAQIDKIDDVWLSLWNSGCDAERRAS